MALLFMESFDGYGGTAANATKWGSLSGLDTTTPTPRTGTYCLQSGVASERVISPGSSTIIVGLAFYWNGSGAGYVTLWRSGFAVDHQCSVGFEGDGYVRVRLGSSGGTIIAASASAVLVGSSWNFIEAKILVDNSGTYSLKVNGVSVLSGSGDTQNQATGVVGGLSLASGLGSAIDDLYVLDSTGSYLNDFIGDCKVECLTPQTGNGTNTGLTCSTGSDHGALVDEFPADDDTTYNSSATPGVKDTYNFTNLASTGTVHAVQATVRAKKTDSAAKTLALVTRQGGADYDGATQAVASTTYAQYQQIWEKRPSDSTVWVVSDVDGAEFGLKVVS